MFGVALIHCGSFGHSKFAGFIGKNVALNMLVREDDMARLDDETACSRSWSGLSVFRNMRINGQEP